VNLKLDENIDARVITLLRLAGHDVATVPGQGLMSAPDEEVIEVCHSEGRCLVTCDRGFGNRVKYNPSNYAGIVIIRLPSRYTFADWQQAIEILIQGLEEAEVSGKLWIIQSGSIQEYQPIEPDI
jgi:predicted nuclease of predicted toxin-antitoxin system